MKDRTACIKERDMSQQEEKQKSRRKHRKQKKNAPRGILIGQRGARLF
jgi:hypothetical protein